MELLLGLILFFSAILIIPCIALGLFILVFAIIYWTLLIIYGLITDIILGPDVNSTDYRIKKAKKEGRLKETVNERKRRHKLERRRLREMGMTYKEIDDEIKKTELRRDKK